MNMSTELEEEIFKGKEKIERKDVENFRIKGLEEIAKDMREHSDWDGVTKVGNVAVRVDRQGKITQDILHLLGSSEPKRLDARLVFGKEYGHEDHQVKVEKVDLSYFRFRGGLRSAFLGSSEFTWSVVRPSKSQPGVWKEVDKAEAFKDGGNPIFMAAVVQPWSGARLKVDVGIVSSTDLNREGDTTHPRFPVVGIYTCFASTKVSRCGALLSKLHTLGKCPQLRPVYTFGTAPSQLGHCLLHKTSQELRMLSSVTLNCQVTKIVMNSGSQL